MLKVEYLSNHWLDLPKILNLGSGYQTCSAQLVILLDLYTMMLHPNMTIYSDSDSDGAISKNWPLSWIPILDIIYL